MSKLMKYVEGRKRDIKRWRNNDTRYGHIYITKYSYKDIFIHLYIY